MGKEFYNLNPIGILAFQLIDFDIRKKVLDIIDKKEVVTNDLIFPGEIASNYLEKNGVLNLKGINFIKILIRKLANLSLNVKSEVKLVYISANPFYRVKFVDNLGNEFFLVSFYNNEYSVNIHIGTNYDNFKFSKSFGGQIFVENVGLYNFIMGYMDKNKIKVGFFG